VEPSSAANASELIPGFEPENELERAVAATPELREGLAWGHPRAGHPEGPVGVHVADLLRAIDKRGEAGERRRVLRFIALVHDAFKYRVHEWLPKTGSNHHAARARAFAERFTDDEATLAVIELHEAGFERMMARIEDPEAFLDFVELDGSTEGKRPEPTRWFREELERRGLVQPLSS
jgi:hypothetical protein